MQSENKLFDDFVKMVNGVAGPWPALAVRQESSMREKDARVDGRCRLREPRRVRGGEGHGGRCARRERNPEEPHRRARGEGRRPCDRRQRPGKAKGGSKA